MSRQSESTPCGVKLALVTTGGTIAGLKTDATHYQSAELTGQTLADRLGLAGLGESVNGSLDINWEVHSPYAIGSQNLTWVEMFTLRELLIQLNADASVQGILVTHGTDTMEDMLFFLSLTLPELSKPMVFTGSMLTSDSPGSDAQSNVSDSVRLLISTVNAAANKPTDLKKPSQLFGLLMNGKFTPASQVQKRSTSGVDAFDPPAGQSNLTPGLPALYATPTLPTWTVAQLIERLQHFILEVVYCTPNLREGAIQSRMESLIANASFAPVSYPSATLIIAAPGNGNIPSRFVPELKALMLQGVRVVRASRISQSPLGKGGELTGLEGVGQSGVGTQLYHEAHGLSLNQTVVMETCRFLALNS